MLVLIQTIGLLVISNLFMTFAWYGHLKHYKGGKIYIAILVSWFIALFEYAVMVPANRIGYTQFSVSQLKIIQEVISLSMFMPFAVFYMKEPFKIDYIYAGICLIGAVYFMFRS